MSTPLEHKIDFVAFISVTMANPNGDPLNGNRPRVGYDGIGEISDVCIKRKIRNRMQDLGFGIFIQSDDRCKDDCKSLKERYEKLIKDKKVDKKDQKALRELLCAEYLDVRAFGSVFAFSSGKNKEGDKGEKGVSIGIRGPISIHQARSIDPIDTSSIQITKSTNGGESDGKSSDRFGMKHFVRFGLYKIQGSISVQLAREVRFSREDAEIVKKCLKTLFVNDSSSARPDGSMEVVKLYWFEHNCANGQYSSAQVHRSVHAKLKDNIDVPTSENDYEITQNDLEGLKPELFKKSDLNL